MRNFLIGWIRKRLRADERRFVAVLYFDGPLTKFKRATMRWHFEEHPGGLRVPLNNLDVPMPEPDEREVIAKRWFSNETAAQAWVFYRLNGFAHCYGEVRPA